VRVSSSEISIGSMIMERDQIWAIFFFGKPTNLQLCRV